MKALLIVGSIVAGIAAGAYIGSRPRLRRYGATDEEVSRALPSDSLVPDASYVTNRVTTFDAPPEAVWPWLAQMGELPRGGFYSFEWIERLLGMQVENADRILDEYQDVRKGDVLDRRGTMTVLDVDPGHWITLGPPDDDSLWLATAWTLALYPDDANRTRLVSRVRARVKRWSPGAAALMAVMDPGQLVMELKMFAELKKRVERPGSNPAPADAPA